MFISWLKKRLEKDDKTLQERIARLESRVTSLDSNILDVCTSINIIRNKVLKKIQFKRIEEEEEEDTPKDAFSSVILPER